MKHVSTAIGYFSTPLKNGRNELAPRNCKSCRLVSTFPLRLAVEGDFVRIAALHGGKGFTDRLAGMGLFPGARVRILRNTMDGKLIIGHRGMRFIVGGGMAQKIQVADIEGGDI